MNEIDKQRIIEFNNQFGIKTEFIKDESILGYTELDKENSLTTTNLGIARRIIEKIKNLLKGKKDKKIIPFYF